MTTIKLLTELTTLPIDIINYCVQPYLTRPRQWQNTFAHTLESINWLGDFHEWRADEGLPEQSIRQTLWKERWALGVQERLRVSDELRAFLRIEY